MCKEEVNGITSMFAIIIFRQEVKKHYLCKSQINNKVINNMVKYNLTKI